MRTWGWIGFSILGALLTLTYLLVPYGLLAVSVYQVVALGGAAGVVAGVLLHRPHRPLPWLLLAAGQLCSAVGDAVYGWLAVIAHQEPYPSAADAFYLAAYPFLVAGLLLLVRERQRAEDADPAGPAARSRTLRATRRVDTAMVTVAVGLPTWIFLGGPALGDSSTGWGTKAIDLAYPVADLVLLALLVRLLVTVAAGTASVRMLTAGAVALPVADVMFGAVGEEGALGLVQSLWFLAAYVLWGAAALHPSMRELTRGTGAVPAPVADLEVTSRRRLAFLVAAVLVPPAVLAVSSLAGEGRSVWPIVVCSVLTVSLGAARMQLTMLSAVRLARHGEQLRAEMTHLAAHDELTDLPNRATILTALQRAQTRSGGRVGVLAIDVDALKDVNETHGQSVGDDVLRALAARFRRAAGPNGQVGRLGGDEFVVVVEEADPSAALQRIAAQLTQVPVHLAERGTWVQVTCSLGATVLDPRAPVGVDELLHEAELAAARAGAEGGARLRVFDEVLRRELAEQSTLEAAVRHGLGAGEFELHYQPVVDLAEQRTRSFEALIRWHRPGSGLVPPDDFIPVVERSNLICELGRWVLRQAADQVREWAGPQGWQPGSVRIAVNLSGRHLAQPGVVGDVAGAARAAGVPPAALIVEVTETVVLDRAEVTENLHALRRLGVGLSLDDFGTGYTSIGQLRTLPVDTLKIDKSFLGSEAAADEELVGLVVHAAHTFGLRVVAEGVEHADQARRLLDLGCDAAQGYYFARPRPASAIAPPPHPGEQPIEHGGRLAPTTP